MEIILTAALIDQTTVINNCYKIVASQLVDNQSSYV